MPRKFTLEQSRAGGLKQGPISKIKGLGIFSLTPKQQLAASIAGGKTQGPIQGALNVASGQWDRISKSPAAVEGRLNWARSDENKKRCSEMGKKKGPNVDWEKVRTTESCKKGQEAGGDKSRHVRWHVNRGIFNLACGLCLEAIARKENWGLPIEEPEN